jgi:hypothetical protein
MNNNETIEQELNKLTDDLNTSYEKIEKGSAYQVVDLLPLYGHLLNANAQAKIDEPRATELIRQNRNTQEFEKVQFFTIQVTGKHNIPKAVELLTEAINRHAEQGHIISFLTPLALIDLYNADFEPRTDENYRCAVFSYPMCTAEGSRAIAEAKYDFTVDEGSFELKAHIKDPDPRLL